MKTIRFGLNYTPSKRWYYCWNDWHPSEIAADFDVMAAIGVDHLRVMLIWPWFQPNPKSVSEAHLARLNALMTLAKERNLDIILCSLTGWLSGYRFLPPSMAAIDIVRNESVFTQIQLYFQELLRVAAPHSNFLGFDLGNEINVLFSELPPAEGGAWGDKLVSWLRPQLNGKWIVNGVDHNPWFSGKAFAPKHLVDAYDAVTIHAWPFFTGCLVHDGLAAPPSIQLSAYLTQLCRHFLAREGFEKPIWIQEFGCSKEWGSEKEMATYLEGSVTQAIHAGATWFTWWCSHEINPKYQFSSLEYDLGLFTIENQPKPLAKVYGELIERFQNVVVPKSPIFDFGADFVPAIVKEVAPGRWLEQSRETTTWKAFDRYMATRKTE